MDLSKKLHSSIPAWSARLFIFLSIVLIPWTIYLSYALPTHHLSNHWDVSWTGLDAAIILALATTGILAYKKSRFIVLSSTITASFLLVDAWFDVLSERRAVDFREALFLAIFVEIPLSILCLTVSWRALNLEGNR